MRRKLPGEQVAKLPLDLEEDCLEIRQKCQRWVDDKKTDISLIKPKVPETGNDREQDNWGPLFSIAGCVGGGWLKAVKEALLSLAKDTDNESLTGRLLLDIRTVFTETTQEKLTSEVLVEKLKEIEDAPWSDWSRGRGLTTNALARQLRHFKIKPYQLWICGGNQRGYSLEQFQDSFERYLSSPEPPIQTGTPVQPNNGAAFRGFQSGTEKKAVPVEKPRKAIAGLGCNSVTVENGVSGEEEKNNSLWEDFS
jgi:putative DNA primase/helicase